MEEFLFVPGDEIPAAFTQEGMAGDEQGGKESFYPGATKAAKVVGNHRPIFPVLTYGVEPGSPAITKARAECMCEDYWAEGNRALSEVREKKGEAVRDHIRRGNVTKAHRGLQDLMNSAVEDQYTKKTAEKGAEISEPLRGFL